MIRYPNFRCCRQGRRRPQIRRFRALILISIGAGFLAGCGASLNGEITPGLSPNEPGSVSGSPQTRAAEPPGADAPAKPTSSTEATGYRIGPQDVLDVAVFKVPELSKSVQVADAGTVNLPLVGEIPAAGKTAQEVERDLTAKLGAKYLRSPQVTVFVKEYNSHQVTVEGAVRKPGVYPIKGKTSLLQAIAMAQGLDPSYDSSVLVFRQTDGERLAAKFDIDDIKNGSAKDPAIYEGDTVVVNSSVSEEDL